MNLYLSRKKFSEQNWEYFLNGRAKRGFSRQAAYVILVVAFQLPLWDHPAEIFRCDGLEVPIYLN